MNFSVSFLLKYSFGWAIWCKTSDLHCRSKLSTCHYFEFKTNWTTEYTTLSRLVRNIEIKKESIHLEILLSTVITKADRYQCVWPQYYSIHAGASHPLVYFLQTVEQPQVLVLWKLRNSMWSGISGIHAARREDIISVRWLGFSTATLSYYHKRGTCPQQFPPGINKVFWIKRKRHASSSLTCQWFVS